MNNVIVAGGRHFNNYPILEGRLNIILANLLDVCIISGGARGADALGELYAKSNNLPCKVFKADWDKHGKAAGHIRNREMAEYSEYCVVFWDGVSRGSKNMIDTATKLGLNVRVIN